MTEAHPPAELHQALAAAYNEKDVEGLLALFEPDASLVPQPATVVRGAEVLATWHLQYRLDSPDRRKAR